jgi:hypothetical protein
MTSLGLAGPLDVRAARVLRTSARRAHHNQSAMRRITCTRLSEAKTGVVDCGFTCHTRVAKKDYIFTAYGRR